MLGGYCHHCWCVRGEVEKIDEGPLARGVGAAGAGREAVPEEECHQAGVASMHLIPLIRGLLDEGLGLSVG